MSIITLDDVKHYLKIDIEIFEADLNNPKLKDKAEILLKHYKRIFSLLEQIE